MVRDGSSPNGHTALSSTILYPQVHPNPSVNGASAGQPEEIERKLHKLFPNNLHRVVFLNRHNVPAWLSKGDEAERASYREKVAFERQFGNPLYYQHTAGDLFLAGRSARGSDASGASSNASGVLTRIADLLAIPTSATVAGDYHNAWRGRGFLLMLLAFGFHVLVTIFCIQGGFGDWLRRNVLRKVKRD
jgi:hypothetical protein